MKKLNLQPAVIIVSKNTLGQDSYGHTSANFWGSEFNGDIIAMNHSEYINYDSEYDGI